MERGRFERQLDSLDIQKLYAIKSPSPSLSSSHVLPHDALMHQAPPTSWWSIIQRYVIGTKTQVIDT
jgi:hypothetical protein